MLCGSRTGIRSIQAFVMLKWIRVNGERGSRPEGRAHFICEYSHESRFIRFLSKEWELRSLAGPNHRTGLRSMHLSLYCHLPEEPLVLQLCCVCKTVSHVQGLSVARVVLIFWFPIEAVCRICDLQQLMANLSEDGVVWASSVLRESTSLQPH